MCGVMTPTHHKSILSLFLPETTKVNLKWTSFCPSPPSPEPFLPACLFRKWRRSFTWWALWVMSDKKRGNLALTHKWRSFSFVSLFFFRRGEAWINNNKPDAEHRLLTSKWNEKDNPSSSHRRKLFSGGPRCNIITIGSNCIHIPLMKTVTVTFLKCDHS